MRNIRLFAIIAAMVVLFSCDEENNPSNTDLLTSSPWIFVSYTVSPAIDWDGYGTMVTDILAQFDACNKDDISDFNTNNTYTLEEGATKCDPNDPQVYETGTWAFNSDETVLVMTDSDGFATNYNIVKISSTEITLKDEYTAANDIKYTFTSVFRHK